MPNNKQKINTDKLEIDTITQLFYSIFTNTSQKPDWNIINEVCIPETIIIKKTGTAEVIYNVKSFIKPRRKILTDGTLTDFKEWEAEEETKIIKNIAQRFSKYQKSGYLQGTYFKQNGKKLFQFIKTESGWKISSLIWEDD